MSPMPREEVVVARSAFGQASSRVLISSAFASSSSTIASTTTSQSVRSLGSVVTRRRDGSAPSILAQAATTFSSARQAEASDRASRIVSAVVVETAARPVAMAPLPAIPGLSYPCFELMGPGSYQPFQGGALWVDRRVNQRSNVCGDGAPPSGPRKERTGGNGARKRRAGGPGGRDRRGG